MAKRLYIYEDVAPINPGRQHDGGGLVIITSGDPLDAWNAYVDAECGEYLYRRSDFTDELPEPGRVIEVPDDTDDGVIVFPDAGCC